MTKSELVNYIAENTGMKKTEANTVLSIIGKAVQKTIDEHSSVTLPGIGTFSFDVAESRMGRIPQDEDPAREFEGKLGKRMTVNDPQSNMELLHNALFVKDHEAMIRDFEHVEDLRSWTRQMLMAFGCIDEREWSRMEDDDYFDEMLWAYFQSLRATDGIKGFIAFTYMKLIGMADLQNKLKAYEDAEQAGEFEWKK
ncbi:MULTISPECIES: HU family DNA-binding protein [unclassified Bilifractor]|uniref:HU family DNA-binding protein n=1 Tax=unclassified Bilifractor TaxID=2815795 RepID=UPI003F8E8E76